MGKPVRRQQKHRQVRPGALQRIAQAAGKIETGRLAEIIIDQGQIRTAGAGEDKGLIAISRLENTGETNAVEQRPDDTSDRAAVIDEQHGETIR